MTDRPPCAVCGGGPTRSWGTRPVKDPALVDGGISFVETQVKRRHCAACNRSHDAPDPAREARTSEAYGFMVACLATEGPERAAAICGVTRKTLVGYVEAEVDRILSGPVPATVFLGARPEPNGPLVLGDGGPGHVLDAMENDAARLGDALDRRGGNVDLAWIPFAKSAFQLAKDTMPDARLVLCNAEATRILDAVVGRMLDAKVGSTAGEAASLREATGTRWTVKDYEHLRTVAARAGMRKAGNTLDLWDEEIRNSLAIAGASPGVRVPDQLGGLTPLRLRSLAAVTPGPTFAAMSRTLARTRQLRMPS